jgi:hypothetical protein
VPTLHGRPRALGVDLRGHWTGRALLAGPFREAMCKVPVGRATVRACPRRRAGQRKRNPDGGQVESHESGRVCESQSHHHPGRACPDSLLPASHRHQTREGGERERRGGKRTDPASRHVHGRAMRNMPFRNGLPPPAGQRPHGDLPPRPHTYHMHLVSVCTPIPLPFLLVWYPGPPACSTGNCAYSKMARRRSHTYLPATGGASKGQPRVEAQQEAEQQLQAGMEGLVSSLIHAASAVQGMDKPLFPVSSSMASRLEPS